MKKQLIKQDSNNNQYIENEYHRSKWVSFVLSLILTPLALIYSREYEAALGVFLIPFILAFTAPFTPWSESTDTLVCALIYFGAVFRFLFISKEEFFKVVNRK